MLNLLSSNFRFNPTKIGDGLKEKHSRNLSKILDRFNPTKSGAWFKSRNKIIQIALDYWFQSYQKRSMV